MASTGRYGIDYSKKELTAGDHKKIIAETTKIIAEGNVDRKELLFAYYSRGIVLDEQDDYEKAILDYTSAIEIDRNFGPAYYNRAIAYFMLGEYDKALSDVNESLKRWSWSERRMDMALVFIDRIKEKQKTIH